MSAWTWIGVALLGGTAAVVRVSVDGFIGARLAGRFQGRGEGLVLGTFVVNLTGAFLLGLVDGLALSADASILIGTAAIGTYTTFSTWMLHSATLGADGERRVALVNIGASVLLGFAAVLLGHVIGRAL